MGQKAKLSVIAVLLTLFICGAMLGEHWRSQDAVIETILYWGSTGSKVMEVQRKLKQWGYYDGPIDGVYGAKTFEAVKLFQRKKWAESGWRGGTPDGGSHGHHP